MANDSCFGDIASTVILCSISFLVSIKFYATEFYAN